MRCNLELLSVVTIASVSNTCNGFTSLEESPMRDIRTSSLFKPRNKCIVMSQGSHQRVHHKKQILHVLKEQRVKRDSTKTII